MKNQKVIVRFDEVCGRDKYGLRRIEGTATEASMIRLIVSDLQANREGTRVPRVSKESRTRDVTFLSCARRSLSDQSA